MLDSYQILEGVYIDNLYMIYRAIRLADKALVFIKVLKKPIATSQGIAWFNNECTIVKELALTEIIKPYQIKKHRQHYALILENFPGIYLNQFLDTRPIIIQDFLIIAIKLVQILQKLHQKQIIHQNFNPSSIVINPETLEIKITNFSIATKFGREIKTNTTELEALDLAYISPEQTGRTNYLLDYRTDFYSLGVILYKILTGQLPCEGRELIESISCHLTQTPVAPHQINSQIPPTVSSIVMKLLAKNPDDRYQSTYGIKHDLESCQTQERNTKTIQSFEIGTLDKRSNFVISEKIYGRFSEIETLQSALERVYSGATELVLVSGQSGLGKTFFIQKFIQSKVQRKGFFITGQFEKLKSNIPYFAIKQAFHSLIQQLLTQNQKSQDIWREKILAVVGDQGKVLTDILPELESIIGSQPPMTKLPAKETENLFNILFVEFIKLFCTKENPLVLFLDDLQWADSASLNLLGHLLDVFDSQYLLFIWAYQDDELKKLSPLQSQIFADFVNLDRLIAYTTETSKFKIAVNTIQLKPFENRQVNQLLVDTLYCQETESLALAELLFEWTKGNPFFVTQLLEILYQEGLFTFDFNHFSWQWNIEAIRATSISDYSLLELVKKNFQKLSTVEQEILQIAACIGRQFDLDSLAIASCQDEAEIVAILKSALQAGIIASIEDSVYQFCNNHLYHFVYSSLAEVEKAKIHLKIGQFWLLCSSPSKIENQIFNLVNQLNLGRIFAEGILKSQIVELNLIAAQKAKKEIAYEVAANYLEIALDLLLPSTWQSNYNLMSKIHLEAIEVQYLQTNFERAEKLANIVLDRSSNVLDKVKVYETKIRADIARNQMQEAIKNGFYALKLLDISLPPLVQKNGDFLIWLEKHSNIFQDLENLPKMIDTRMIAAMNILGLIVPPIYIVKPQLFPGLVVTMIDFCLQYGNSAFSAFAYALYGLLLCASGNIDTGYEFGQLAITIQKQLASKELSSRINFIFNSTIRHWKQSTIHTIGYFLEGIQEGIEVGDLEHACFHAKYYCTYLFFIGEPLPSVEEKSQEQINLIQIFKQDFQLNYARLWQQVNLNLQGLGKHKLLLIGTSFDEDKMLSLWQESNNATSLFAFYLAKLILCYFFKDYPQAVINAQKGKQYLAAAVGTMCFSIYHFYAALAMLAVCSPQNLQSESLVEIVAYQEKIKIWANYAPDNYLNKYQLVTAEIARVLGNNKEATDNYDLAITSAEKAGYSHEAALAEELTGKFYLFQNRKKVAGYYLSDAYEKYIRWGALAKTQALESEYSNLLNQKYTQTLTNDLTDKVKQNIYQTNLAKLDLLSVIEASQTIASEIILDNLLSKMMKIVIKNSGAQRAILLLQQDSLWIVAASAILNPETQVVLSNIPITEYLELPHSIINYLQSTNETVILEKASENSLFNNDPYLIKHQPQSILAYPMITKNQLQGIIYLENNLIRGVFTSHKVEVLQVLLSQVSISLENARLYKDLENHASVQESLKQKEVLLKEIHHRVKNNLLVVSSLLDLQSNYIDEPKVIKILENCQNRIISMALVHQHLYGSSELNTINFANYIQSLLDNVAYSQACEERNINLSCNLQEIELNIETANPCGLIVNELVSNAIEHGFKNSDCGNIWVSLQQNSANEVVLTIKDDGVGFGDNLDLSNSNSLGLKLVNTLVKQLEGTIKLDKENGTIIEIIFKKLEYTSRI